jgi:hypothetical protein
MKSCIVIRVATFFPFQTTYYLNGHSFKGSVRYPGIKIYETRVKVSWQTRDGVMTIHGRSSPLNDIQLPLTEPFWRCGTFTTDPS